MKRRSIYIIVLIFTLVAVLAACEPGRDSSQSSQEEGLLSGSAEEVLEQLLEAVDLEFSVFTEAVDEENSASYTGLTYLELTEQAQEAFSSQAEININPHLLVVLKGQDPAAARQLSEQIAEKFDSHRWVCVMPDQSFVVTAGDYVLLASTNNDIAEMIKVAFFELAGPSAGEVNEFFQFSAD